MNKAEAQEILITELLKFREMSYEDLQRQIGSAYVVQRKGASGDLYTIEIEVFLDNPRDPGGHLRVFGSIDDGGFLSALSPLSSDFIIDADGNFIGE
ncbi:hypothetical protein ACFLY4_02320 [Chloroflexota bacterium]